MVYKFDDRIVNNGNVNSFFDKKKFVGYILPDGEIYHCINHNVSNVGTVLDMDIELLKSNFADKDKILTNNTSDKLMQLVINYLYRASYDEIVALSKFIKENSLGISDLIVQLFGCHLVTRLNKTILTSETNHSPFFNYLLNDFSVCTIDKIMYDNEKKEYVFIHGVDRNEYLYDEIERIKKSVNTEEIELFYKVR